MKHSLRFFLQSSLFLGVLVSAGASAADASMCTSLCSAEKRECRAGARHKTGLDLSPLAQDMKGSRDARALEKIQSTPAQNRSAERSEFDKRLAEREGECDSKAMACTRACATPTPAQSTRSVVLKPNTQQ